MKKSIALIIAAAMLLSFAACGNTAQTDHTTETAAAAAEELKTVETTISGSVKSVDGEKITVTTEENEEIVFTVTDATEYAVEMSEMPSGDGQQGGSAPEMPNGDGQQGGNPPEMPNGDGQQGGNPPEMPNGDGQQGGSAPEMPNGDGQQGGNPPEMPNGDGQQGGSAPEMPNGDGQQGGSAPEMPSGGDMQVGPDMLTEGTKINVTLAEDGSAAQVTVLMSGGHGEGSPGGGFPGGGFGGGQSEISYTAVNTYNENTQLSGQTISSTGKDENAILVTGGETELTDVTVERVSADSTGGDNSSFYGVGAAVLATDGSVSISGSTITTDAAGGAGVFAYGDGTAYVSDSTITTQQNTSGGIHVAGGGTLYAWDLNVETNGESAAAIRSDRGSGTMVVDGGSYTSNGIGSPAIYSTADISVNDAELTANGSEAVCIEGKNSVRLYDCNLTGNMSDDSRNDCTWNVILYQSMSGDSVEGNSLFEMEGGTLTAKNGGVFYTTNTESTFILSGVEILSAEDSEFLLKCTGNSNERGWGSSGANGAQCTFSAISQTMTGNVIWDSISTLDFYMTEGSTLTGAFLQDESNAGAGGDGYAAVHIAEGCTWVVTKDSTLSSLELAGSMVDENGETVSVIGTDGTVYVSGSSAIVVTVESFSDTADLSGCGTVSDFAEHAVEKP